MKSYDESYVKIDCIVKLPKAFQQKQIGRSMFYEEIYDDNICSKIQTKRKSIFEDEKMLDGSCVKYHY